MNHGAKLVFTGMVRSSNHGRQVIAVEYDIFRPLLDFVFQKIKQEAKDQWGQDLEVSIEHCNGRLEPGQTSVVIAVSSKHRDESYQASRYVIEQIKKRAPIWKKEFYADGETEWLQGHALCQH